MRTPFLDNAKLKMIDYITELSIPNFMFHITHAYAILRANGVDVGKRDFIPTLKFIEE